ncbi:hypothetical protein ACFV08_26445, partial [Streptomyces fradiae]
MEPPAARGPSTRRRRRTVRLRTLLVLLAVVPTVAMAGQVAVTSGRLLEQSAHLRADVAVGERVGVPLYGLMTALQAERTATAAYWAEPSEPGEELAARRTASDPGGGRGRRGRPPGGGGARAGAPRPRGGGGGR